MTGLLKKLITSTALISISMGHVAYAQITTDGTTPTTCNGGTCSGSTGNVTISGGAIMGVNQFHSFADFNVALGDTANFTGPTGIENIISRVTGGNPTNIFGNLVSSSVSGTDFYFVNPNGVLFGEDSSVFVSGGAHFSTSDNVGFADGTSLNSSSNVASSFSSATPESFGFIGSGNSDIVVNGNIRSQTLSLFAENIITSDANLSGFGGELQIGAIGTNSMVVVIDDPGLSNYNGSILIDNSDVRFEQISTFADETNVMGGSLLASLGGDINIATRTLNVQGVSNANGFSGSSISGSFFTTDVDADAPDVNVFNIDENGNQIRSESVMLSDGAVIQTRENLNPSNLTPGSNSSINIFTRNFEAQNTTIVNGLPGIAGTNLPTGGSTVNLEAGATSIIIDASERLTLVDTTIGSAPALANSASADITLNGDEIILSNSTVANEVTISPLGLDKEDGGSITFNGDVIILNNGSTVSTSTVWNSRAGDITFNVGELLELGIFSMINSSVNAPSFLPSPSNYGDAGDIRIQGDTAILRGIGSFDPNLNGFDIPSIEASNNGASFAENALNDGNAGNILIDVDLVDGIMRIGTETRGSGAAGSISLDARELRLPSLNNIISTQVVYSTSGDQNENSTIDINVDRLISNGGRILTLSNGIQSGGDVNIQANFVSLDNSTFSSDTTSDANAGNINIISSQLDLNSTDVSSSTSGGGNAGDILISANNLLSNNSIVSSQTGVANAGFGVVITNPLATGDAGSIVINSIDSVRLSNFSELSTNTSSNGRAGEIELSVSNGELTGDGTSLITTSTSGSGDAGSVILSANNIVAGFDVASATTGAGSAGSIQVASNNLDLLSGNAFSTTVGSGSGNAGGSSSITFDIADTLSLGGTVTSNTEGLQNAGAITINASNFDVNGGTVSSDTSSGANAGSIDVNATAINFQNGVISSGSSGAGSSGAISINSVENFVLNSGEVSTETTSSGLSGTITILVSDGQLIANNSVIESSALSVDAGSITIKAQGGVVISDGNVSTSSSGANAGEIVIQMGDGSFLSLTNAQITTSGNQTAGSGASGGTITIESCEDGPIFVVLSNSQIEAQGDNPGALLSIDTNAFLFQDNLSTIAVDGTVNSPDAQVGGDNENLDENFENADQVLASQCAAQRSGDASGLAILPEMGLTTSPNLKPSPLGGTVSYGNAEEENAISQVAQASFAKLEGCL